MNKPIYDYKGRVVGYETVQYPSGENIVIRAQRLTKEAEVQQRKDDYEKIWRNRVKG